MFRLRTSPTGVIVPASGHLGRGAWICPGALCLKRAVTSGSLARALRCAPEQDPEALVGRLASLFGVDSGVDV